jgi:hypothetical protein
MFLISTNKSAFKKYIRIHPWFVSTINHYQMLLKLVLDNMSIFLVRSVILKAFCKFISNISNTFSAMYKETFFFDCFKTLSNIVVFSAVTTLCSLTCGTTVIKEPANCNFRVEVETVCFSEMIVPTY